MFKPGMFNALRRRLGGDRRSPSTVESLRDRGFALVPGAFRDHEVRALREELDAVFERFPPDMRDGRTSSENAAMFRYEVFNRSALGQRVICDRRILDVVEPLLGNDCHAISCTAWRNPADPSHAPRGQEWHIDAGPFVPRPEGVSWPKQIPYPVFVIATHVFLEDCRLEDGPTACVPRSHRSGRVPPRELRWQEELSLDGERSEPLLASAGDLGFFVSDVWHRRLPPRRGGSGRYFLQTNYGRRDIAQRVRPTSAVNHVTDEARARARSARERTVLGIHPGGLYDG